MSAWTLPATASAQTLYSGGRAPGSGAHGAAPCPAPAMIISALDDGPPLDAAGAWGAVQQATGSGRLTSAPAAALLGAPVLVQLFGEVVVVVLAQVLLLVALVLPVLLVLVVVVHAVAFAVHLGVGLLGQRRCVRRRVLLVGLTGRGH